MFLKTAAKRWIFLGLKGLTPCIENWVENWRGNGTGSPNQSLKIPA